MHLRRLLPLRPHRRPHSLTPMHFLLLILGIPLGLILSGFVIRGLLEIESHDTREEWSDPHPDSDAEMYAWMLAQEAKRLKGKCKVSNEK
jgi:hypothetical protein